MVFRPLIERFEERGHQVLVTARDFAQTLDLLSMFNIKHEVIGSHKGKSIVKKAFGLFSRSSQLVKFARKNKPIDLAIGHNSNDLAVAARLTGIKQVTMFDYEFAKVSHHLNLRLVDYVLVPELISKEALSVYGAAPKRIKTYPGLKEEYYLSGFEPDPSVIDDLGLEPAKIIAVVRTPPHVTLYHRKENPIHDGIIEYLSDREDVSVVVLPRTREQEEKSRSIAAKNVIVPDGAVDGLSLIYYADLVIGAGGTMNREAVVLGTPAYSTFSGRLGAVDEYLIKEGKLKRIASVEDIEKIELKKKESTRDPQLRNPDDLVSKILSLVQ